MRGDYSVRRAVYEGPAGTHVRYLPTHQPSGCSPVILAVLYLAGLVLLTWAFGWLSIPPFATLHDGANLYEWGEQTEHSSTLVDGHHNPLITP